MIYSFSDHFFELKKVLIEMTWKYYIWVGYVMYIFIKFESYSKEKVWTLNINRNNLKNKVLIFQTNQAYRSIYRLSFDFHRLYLWLATNVVDVALPSFKCILQVIFNNSNESYKILCDYLHIYNNEWFFLHIPIR
jgi:hypothetical protein